MSQRYIGDLVNGQAKAWPGTPTVLGLAHALRTTPLAIVLGYAVELEVPIAMPEFASRLPPGVDDLPESVRETLLGLLWSLTTDGPARRYLPDGMLLDADAIEGEDVVEGPPTEQTERGQQ